MNKANTGKMDEENQSIEEIVHDENDPAYFDRDQDPKNTSPDDPISRQNTSVLSNRSSYFSQLSKMTSNISQILQELEKKNLPIDLIYEKWPLYFSQAKPVFSKKNLAQILVLNFLHKFITDHENNQLGYLKFKRREGEHPVEVYFDFSILENFKENGDFLKENFDQRLFEIFRFFEQLPGEYLNSLNLALDNFNEWILQKKPKRIVTRVKGRSKMVEISDIDTSSIDKFVKFRCQIVSVSAPRLFIRSMEVKCKDCNEAFTHYLKEGVLHKPEKCVNTLNCQASGFIYNKAKAETGFYQRVKVEEYLPKQSKIGAGIKQIRHSIDIELQDGLINTLNPQDVLEISGILKLEGSVNAQDFRKMKNASFFDSYIKVNNLQKIEKLPIFYNNPMPQDSINQVMEALEDTDIAFYLLLRSFCPNVHGQELAKSLLILSLIGGSDLEDVFKDEPDCVPDNSSFSGKIHLLLLGERGVGKSYLLNYASYFSSNYYYFEGSNKNISDFIFEAKLNKNKDLEMKKGVLCLSDGGACMIDGIGNMSKGHMAVLEVIERQRLSIYANSISIEYPVRSTIIASAEPKSKKVKTVEENFRNIEHMIPQFDIVFLMTDDHSVSSKEKQRFDTMTTERRRDRTSGGGGASFKNNKLIARGLRSVNKDLITKGVFDSEEMMPYSEKLKVLMRRITPDKLLPDHVIKFAIQHFRMDKNAAVMLKNYFMSLAENVENKIPIVPVNVHLMKSMIKVAQALAKLRGKKEAGAEEAAEVRDIFDEILFKRIVNKKQVKPRKVIDRSDISHLSLQKQTKVFLEVLNEEAKAKNDFKFGYNDMADLAKGMNMNVGSDFFSYMERLCNQNHLLMKANKVYELITRYF